MTVTYYVPKLANGGDIAGQQKKLGTPSYGYATLAAAQKAGKRAKAAYIEIRYFDRAFDWSDSRIIPLE